MGVVYEAFDRKRGQRICVKTAKLGFRRALSPELEGALKVRHPNICVVNEIHTAQTPGGEVDFLTMEFLEGETLSTHLALHGRLSPGGRPHRRTTTLRRRDGSPSQRHHPSRPEERQCDAMPCLGRQPARCDHRFRTSGRDLGFRRRSWHATLHGAGIVARGDLPPREAIFTPSAWSSTNCPPAWGRARTPRRPLLMSRDWTPVGIGP